MKYKSLKGVHDIYPPDIFIWQRIENISRDIFRNYGYREIRLPIIESTEIFTRSIGETTDIVEKEMYTFTDKGGRSVTLRPEGTASFIRSYVEHYLYNEPSPQKFYYMGPMFRYERPQSGRQRQFYQIGAEVIGAESAMMDAEVISMLSLILERIGLDNLSFEITSIGCPDCRPAYTAALKDYIREKIESFCDDCRRRFDINPLRLLDCKVPSCIKEREGSPAVIEHLCGGCGEHLESLKHHLRILGVSFVINPALVRGLDYYTKTAFEVKSMSSSGSQNAVAAGGRYDRMVKEFGGPDLPGIGFAIGMERIIQLARSLNDEFEGPDIFICSLGDDESAKALGLANRLRQKGVWAEVSHDKASLRSQMNRANRIGAKSVIVIGENELKCNTAKLKAMKSGESSDVSLSADDIATALNKLVG
ncbi:MAG: histidine--tRNA ligase [Nitrospirae bacterium]|nr:histidine--tRNA ligase [Nitrospirota bacterium]